MICSAQLLIESAHRLKIHIESLAAEIIAPRGGDNQRVLCVSFARQSFGYLKDATASGLAFLLKLRTFWHKVQFEAVGQDDVSRFVQQLRTFHVREFGHCGEAIATMRALFLDTVLGFHRKFARHLVAVVTFEISIEQFVVTRDASSDTGGVRGEDRAHFRTFVLQEEHAETGHPFVRLVNHATLRKTMFAQCSRKTAGSIGKHRSFVIITISVQRIHLE